ncbi:hypothetical protein MSPP1_003622 [Malassezia sp. CBS 17886]|nr:hypothetical protein MSPP1_003622 [Malassezia sp. CBS 17886]
MLARVRVRRGAVRSAARCAGPPARARWGCVSAPVRALSAGARESAGDGDGGPSPARTVGSIFMWVPVALFVTGNVVSIANVKGTSMSPTFNPVDPREKLHPDALPSSDIVSPMDPSVLLTKRILALGGDAVDLWVPRSTEPPTTPRTTPGSVASLGYISQYQHALCATASHSAEDEGGTWLCITIPENYVWIEGDASAAQPGQGAGMQSQDSREFGPVPIGLVTSRIEETKQEPTGGDTATSPAGARSHSSSAEGPLAERHVSK